MTGASGGIGLVTASRFLDLGAKVTLQYTTQPRALDDLLARYPHSAHAVRADCTIESDVASSMAAAVARFGTVQTLIVNHGIWPTDDVAVKDMSLAQWNHTIAVNLTGTFLYVREFLRQVESARASDNISVVMIGSTAGKFGEALHADYAVTKSAMMQGMLLSLKNEIVKVAPRGRVNCVAPGWVRTPMAERAMQDAALLGQALATSPLKKVSTPLDIANAIVFLASEKLAGNITGHVIDVNAGMEGRIQHARL